MPRRRKITIRASELECFETLVRELQQRPEFAGFDPSSLHVWAYERYEPKLKDADAILRRFDYWLGVHKTSDTRPVDYERMAGAVPRSDLKQRRHLLCGQCRSGGTNNIFQ